MAIEIIKKGRDLTPKYKAECPDCGCIFSYQEEDVLYRNFYNNVEYVNIRCPHCENNFYTEYIEMKEDKE